MQIAENKVVAIDYKLTDDKGNLLDDSTESGLLYYLHGVGELVPGLEEAMLGKAVGDHVKVTVTPENGYGERDPDLIREIPMDMFEVPEELEPGLQFDIEDEEEFYIFTILEVKEDVVVADGNPELAGMTVTFEVDVREIRDATEVEIDHQHAHGPNMEDH